MQTLLIIFMMPFALLGLMLFWFVFKSIDKKIEEQTGFDVSNRINRISAIWRTMRTPWKLVELWPWMKLDEGEK